MIILQLKGGLGNQMFQYALYTQLRHLGKKVKIDDITGFREDAQRDPALSVLGITYERATQEEITEITDSYMDFGSRVRRKLFGRKSKRIDEVDGNFHPEILDLEDAYLVGYWQSEKYFPDEAVREQLNREFLQNRNLLLNQTITEEIKTVLKNKEQTVSLHIRRGDYLQPGTIETFGGICTEEYYDSAIQHIKERVPDAKFLVFSNDTEWAREKYQGKEFLIVNLRSKSDISLLEHPSSVDVQSSEMQSATSQREDDYCAAARLDAAELFLMTSCHHHIMANSSFSWWGTWLGEASKDEVFENADKEAEPPIVIAPAKWLNNQDLQDIYTPDMIRMNHNGEIEQ